MGPQKWNRSKYILPVFRLGGILGENSKDSKALRFVGSVLFTRWTKLLVPLFRLVILIGSDLGCRHRILRLFPDVQTGHHRSISPKRDRQITFQRTQPSHSVWHCSIDLLRNDTLLPWGERAARCGWKSNHPTSVVGDEIFLSLPMFSGTHMHLGLLTQPRVNIGCSFCCSLRPVDPCKIKR